MKHDRNSVKAEYKELVGMFETLTGSRNILQVFNDSIECFAITLRNVFGQGTEYEKLEKRYREIMHQYTADEHQQIVKIFAKITNMLEKQPFRDLFGDVYMQLNMGSSALGQFFTPYHLSLLLVECAFQKELCKQEIKKKGYVTVHEPAIGGAAYIIAFCEILKENGFNYQSQCIIQCQELSRLPALMCYVALSLLGCSAVIKIGDTLANPYTNYYDEIAKGSELWVTPMFHINNCYSKI